MYVDLKYKGGVLKSDANDDPIKRKLCNSASSTSTGDEGFVTAFVITAFSEGIFFCK